MLQSVVRVTRRFASIKFPVRRDENGSALLPLKLEYFISEQSKIAALLPTIKAATPSSNASKSSKDALPFDQTPARFQRKALTSIEIDAITSGGAY